MQETHLGNVESSQQECESSATQLAREESMKTNNNKYEQLESNINITLNENDDNYDDNYLTKLENEEELSEIEEESVVKPDALESVMESVENEHVVQREHMEDYDESMLNNETEIIDELEVYHAQMQKNMHLTSPLRHLMKEYNFNVVDYSDKTSTSLTSSELSSSSASSAPTSESYSYTSSSIASNTCSETEMSTKTTSTLVYETHANNPSTVLKPENENAAHERNHILNNININNSSRDDTIPFTLNANNNNNNTAYTLLPELMNDMDGELLEIIRSYYARKQQLQQQQQLQEGQEWKKEKLSHDDNNHNNNSEKESWESQIMQHNLNGKTQVVTSNSKERIHKNNLDRRESNNVESSLRQATNKTSKVYAHQTEQIKLPEPPTLNVMDGNYIGDDIDSKNKLRTDKQRTKHERYTNNTISNENSNRHSEFNGALRNRHRRSTNNTQNANRSNRPSAHVTQQNAHEQHHFYSERNNNNHISSEHPYRIQPQREEEEEQEFESESEYGELLHEPRRTSVERRNFADDFRLPEYSSTSFVRAYFGDIHLNAEPAVLVSGLAAAVNMVIVLFLQHHVLDTHDHLGLFLIGSYLVFATYYMTYYFLERFSSSFRTITSLDKKFYVISNLLKAGIFVSITPFAFYHLIQIIVFDKWENNILRNLGCIYTVPDFIAIIIVKRMRWSTWIHHWCVVAFNYFSIMNDYRNENVCRCVVVYAAFSSFAYCVNVLLASRFLGLPTLTSHILAYVALTVYALCCAVNWVWQAYYLHRLMITGHAHWTVYAYILLISLVMWDDVVLTKWLYNNAQSSAFVMAARQQQQENRQEHHREEKEEHHREEQEKKEENY